MFAGGEDCMINLRLKWSELLKKKSMVSEAVRVYGLDWFLHLNIDFANHMCLRVGFKQIPTGPVTCATHIRYILDSMDPNGARFSLTRGTVSVCDLKSPEPSSYVSRNRIEQLLNDGWLIVFAKLHIFKPVPFSPIPSHFAFSFSAPSQSVYPVAERNGLIYLLTKHSDVSDDSFVDATQQSDVSEDDVMQENDVSEDSFVDVTQQNDVSEDNIMSQSDDESHTPQEYIPPSDQLEQWAVQCMRAFDKESTVTLAMISVKPEAYVGNSIDTETKQIAVTQMVDDFGEDNPRIQLDLVDLGGGVQTRCYQIPQNDMDRYSAQKAVKTSQGWIMADSALYFQGDELSVCFRFWLLAEELTLFSELRRSKKYLSFPVLQSISCNALYCAFASPTFEWHILVYDLLDHPSVWKEYQICPGPVGDDMLLLHVWPEPVLAAWVSTNHGKRLFLFRLEFTTSDCLLIPFLALPRRLAVKFAYEKACFNPGTVLVLDKKRNDLMLLHLRVPRLKTLALLQVQRLLGELVRVDGQGQPIWKLWKHKLDRLIGTKVTTSYL